MKPTRGMCSNATSSPRTGGQAKHQGAGRGGSRTASTRSAGNADEQAGTQVYVWLRRRISHYNRWVTSYSARPGGGAQPAAAARRCRRCGRRRGGAGRRRCHRSGIRQLLRPHHAARRRHRAPDQPAQGPSSRSGRQCGDHAAADPAAVRLGGPARGPVRAGGPQCDGCAVRVGSVRLPRPGRRACARPPGPGRPRGAHHPGDRARVRLSVEPVPVPGAGPGATRTCCTSPRPTGPGI